MRFRLLGPLEVAGDGEEDLTPTAPKERLLLVVLLLAPEGAVSTDRLVEVLWSGDPPESALHALHVYVSNLRRRLGEERIRTIPSGYQVVVDPGERDIDRFEARLEAGRRVLAQGRTEDALEELDRALGLWRGPMLPDLVSAPSVGEEAVRLEELRLTAVEERMEALLALGRDEEVVAEAEPLVTLHPFRERLWSQLITALARTGRQGDALRAYQRLREILGEELGIEPSPELRDLEERVLLQLEARSAGSIEDRSGIPEPLTSFVGRDRELERVEELMARTRLLTLTGVGGVGKTRLALEAARRLEEEFPDGVWVVELGSLEAGAAVPRAVAQALGVREDPRYPLRSILADHIGDRRMLVVLDNCEHVAEACAALVEQLLERCPALEILTTSREPLRVAPESVYRVPCLSLPEDGGVEAVTGSEAGRLFLERASAADPDFVLDPQEAPALASICRRLDGIPLALELAAVRVGGLSPSEILDGLPLESGRRTEVARHRTLRACMEWSHRLLSLPERRLLRRLSVFRGPFTVEAARRVAAGEGLTEDRVTEALGSVAEKSLLVRERASGRVRYGMLETVRRFARERLVEAGEEEQVGERHAAYCLELMERAADRLRGPDQAVWATRVAEARDDLRAALEWFRRRDDAEGALRLAGAAWWWFWLFQNHLVDEGREWLGSALRMEGGSVEARFRAHLGVGMLASIQDDLEAARRAFRVALGGFREFDDRWGQAFALRGLGGIALRVGEREEALRLGEASVTLAEEIDAPLEVGFGLVILGGAAEEEGDHREALRCYEEALRRYEEAGHERAAAWIRRRCATARLRLGQADPRDARAELQESLATASALGDRHGMAHARRALGELSQERGRLEEAERHLLEALDLYEEIGDAEGLARSLRTMAGLLERRGRHDEATRLLGAVAAFREAPGAAASFGERRAHEALLAELGRRMGRRSFNEELARGREMGLEEAVARARRIAPAGGLRGT